MAEILIYLLIYFKKLRKTLNFQIVNYQQQYKKQYKPQADVTHIPLNYKHLLPKKAYIYLIFLNYNTFFFISIKYEMSSESKVQQSSKDEFNPECAQTTPLMKLDQQDVRPLVGIILIHYENAKDKTKGTGFLISKDLVLTAGHLFINKDKNMTITKISFYPGVHYYQDQFNEEYQYYEIDLDIYMPQMFRNEELTGLQRYEYDYALLRLKVDKECQYFYPLKISHHADDITNMCISLNGYPQFKKNRLIQYESRKENVIRKLEERQTLFYHDLSSDKGMSGGPLIIKLPQQTQGQQNNVIYPNQQAVIGIHLGYDKDRKNVGKKTTKQLILQLQNWRKKHNASAFQVMFGPFILSSDIFCYKMNFDQQMLLQQNQRLKDQVSSLKQNNVERQQKLRMQEDKLKLQENKIRLQQLKSGVQERLVEVKKSEDLSLEKLIDKSQQKLDNPTPQILQMPASYWDRKSYYEQNFIIENNIVTRNELGGCNFFQIVSVSSLSSNSQSVTRFKILKFGGNNCICFGIITKSRLRERWSGYEGDSHQSVGYWSNPLNSQGKININGKVKAGWKDQLFVAEGEILEMTVNIPLKMIQFKNSKKAVRHELDRLFEGIEIYAYVAIRDYKTSVEIV